MGKPKREVFYDGSMYKVRSDKIEIPDLEQMERIGALVWLIQNTYPTGNGIRTKPNPLQGLGGGIKFNTY